MIGKAIDATGLAKKANAAAPKGKKTLGASLSSAGFWIVMLFGIVQALAQLDATMISEPLTNVLNTIMDYIPKIIGAVIVFGVFMIVANVVKHALGSILELANGLPEKAGLASGPVNVSGIVANVAFGFLAIAAYFGIFPPSEFVAKTVAFAFGLAASSFFPTILMGIFSKLINKFGAIAGMVAGIALTLTYIIYFQFVLELGPDEKAKDFYLLGISPEGIGFVGMIVNFVVTFAVSSVTPAPSKEIVEMVEEIRRPNDAGAATH